MLKLIRSKKQGCYDTLHNSPAFIIPILFSLNFYIKYNMNICLLALELDHRFFLQSIPNEMKDTFGEKKVTN